MADWLKALDEETPVDLAYANAGIADGVRRRAYEPEALSRAMFDTNLYGVMNTIYPLLPGMQARGAGQICHHLLPRWLWGHGRHAWIFWV